VSAFEFSSASILCQYPNVGKELYGWEVVKSLWEDAIAQSGQLLPLFLFEFRYLPTTLASEATSVAFTKIAGRITVLLSNGALGYSHTLAFSHLIPSLLDIVTSLVL